MCLRKLWNQKRKIGFQRRSWHKRQCNEWCEDEHSSSSPVFNAMISCFVEPLTPYGVVCSRHECYERACGRFHFSKMVQTSGSWPFLYHDSLLWFKPLLTLNKLWKQMCLLVNLLIAHFWDTWAPLWRRAPTVKNHWFKCKDAANVVHRRGSCWCMLQGPANALEA